MRAIKKHKDTKSKSAPDKASRRYGTFRRIDGRHPFKQAVPGGFVDYAARRRHGGKVFYFNFDLAVEMGLIPPGHPHELNAELSEAILDTFALQIINEYDIIHGTKIDPKDVKPHCYMATRYLQLQHPDKRGTTSGDGRSIWNGSFTHRGVTWDVSSCGTGATCLSPATAIRGKFFKTGSKEVSYGCGYADLLDGVGAALMSEILHRGGVRTERTLAIISFERGLSINVRAGRNLLRPSHFFHHLRQNNYGALKAAVDYYIDRQVANGDASFGEGKRRYAALVENMAVTFAKSAAQFESEYLFVWMDWDGDNILADGGIIDYGSVRQFGLFHDEYRYDDVDRMSTTIKEQRLKARAMIQSFCQLGDFLTTGQKKPRTAFAKHPALKLFDTTFEDEMLRLLLAKLGLTAAQRAYLLRFQRPLVERFRSLHVQFERAKAQRGPYKLEDGITWDAVYCMRDLLRELPRHYVEEKLRPTPRQMMTMMASSYAGRPDRALTQKRVRRMTAYLETYEQLFERAARHEGRAVADLVREVAMRSSHINRAERVTGNGILFVAERILKDRGKLSQAEIQRIMSSFIRYQISEPSPPPKEDLTRLARRGRTRPLARSLMRLVAEHRETV